LEKKTNTNKEKVYHIQFSTSDEASHMISLFPSKLGRSPASNSRRSSLTSPRRAFATLTGAERKKLAKEKEKEKEESDSAPSSPMHSLPTTPKSSRHNADPHHLSVPEPNHSRGSLDRQSHGSSYSSSDEKENTHDKNGFLKSLVEYLRKQNEELLTRNSELESIIKERIPSIITSPSTSRTNIMDAKGQEQIEEAQLELSMCKAELEAMKKQRDALQIELNESRETMMFYMLAKLSY